jgi:hypothetical protein
MMIEIYQKLKIYVLRSEANERLSWDNVRAAGVRHHTRSVFSTFFRMLERE